MSRWRDKPHQVDLIVLPTLGLAVVLTVVGWLALS